MARERGLFRDAGPVILRLEQRAAWRLDAGQFRRMVLLLSVVALGLLALTWGRVRVLANGYQIMELRQERDRLASEHRRLESRLDEMQSLAYAEEEARTRLGMVEVNPNQVITLRQRSAARDLVDGMASLFHRDGAPPEAPKAAR